MESNRYPIGTQSFEVLRTTNSYYVDKTQYVYRLAHNSARTYFLSRPRRFGKSLFLSTLEAYFSGRKELFEGLAIYNLEQDWHSYPILHFDLSVVEAETAEKLEYYIYHRIRRIADVYGVSVGLNGGIGNAFGDLIEEIVKKCRKQVVILIDEYDKGIVEDIEDSDKLEANQNILRPFFAQIKSQNANIRFCFITGVTRFRHYTLFSGFNNPDDLSMNPDYAAICGITIDELLSTFGDGIHRLSEELGVSETEVVDLLKQKYDGYRFTRDATKVFNPFSLINSLNQRELANYWLQSGTSRVFVTYLSKSNFDICDLTDMWVTKDDMESTFNTRNPIPLLFQTGYLTIRDYDSGLYKLDIPNGEVRGALVNELIPNYMGIKPETMPRKVQLLQKIVKSGDVDRMMNELKSMLASVSFHELDFKDIEKSYHLLIYSIFLIIGVDVRSEIAMSGGRIDMVVETPQYVYVMEFKLNDTAQKALEQIDDRGYALPWCADGRKVIKVGISFSSRTRTIDTLAVATV